MRIFDLFYFICMAGMVLAFFGPNLSMINVPNIFDRYKYFLKHKLECDIRINDKPDEERCDSAITLNSSSSRRSPPNVAELAKDIMKQVKSSQKQSSESFLQDAVDKIFKNKSLHKSLSKDWRNLAEHGNLKSIVDKIGEVAANGQNASTMDEVAKAVNNIFKEVQDLDDENSDIGMRKIFEQLHNEDEDSDDFSNSE